MKPRERLERDARYSQILDAALELAAKIGYDNMTRDAVAEHAKVSAGQVNWQFGTMEVLKASVIQAAIDREQWPIVVQGLANRHPTALRAHPDVRAKALAHLA